MRTSPAFHEIPRELMPSSPQEYWETVRPTYIENWPLAWHKLSCASEAMILSRRWTLALGRAIVDWGQCFPDWDDPGLLDDDAEILRSIAKTLGEMIERMNGEAFVRLGSRSAKDSLLAHDTGPKATNGRRALELLTSNSQRVYEDLTLALNNNYEPRIWVRKWLNLDYPFEEDEKQGWSEFRCFVQNHELVGISQYNYNRPYPVIIQSAEQIEVAIRELHGGMAWEGLANYVFDCYVRASPDTDSAGYAWEARLLEVNPFCGFTDPCLFDWCEKFDGGFRYATE